MEDLKNNTLREFLTLDALRIMISCMRCTVISEDEILNAIEVFIDRRLLTIYAASEQDKPVQDLISSEASIIGNVDMAQTSVSKYRIRK
jgi:hypothetical protein